MKVVANLEPSKPHICVMEEVAKSNELKNCYLRFEMQDLSNESKCRLFGI